jgi:hypothetical protein
MKSLVRIDLGSWVRYLSLFSLLFCHFTVLGCRWIVLVTVLHFVWNSYYFLPLHAFMMWLYTFIVELCFVWAGEIPCRLWLAISLVSVQSVIVSTRSISLRIIKLCILSHLVFRPMFDGFGGLVVSMLASGTQSRGFKPGWNRWIFTDVKILSMLSSGGEVK